MAAKQATENVLGTLSLPKQVLEKASKTEVDYGVIQLPPGISNGIAELTECYFAKYATGDNKGQPYFRATGVVIYPHDIQLANGSVMKVEGLQTSIMIPCCDTKTKDGKVTTANEYLTGHTVTGEYTMERKAFVMNEIKKLAGQDYLIGITSAKELEDKVNILSSTNPPIRFRFSTSLRKAQVDPITKQKIGEDGVWQNWHGYTQDVPSETTAVSHTPSTNGGINHPAMNATVDNSRQASWNQVPATNGTSSQEVSPDGAEEDIENLAKLADNGDESAALHLQEVAKMAGLEDADIEKTNSYEELVSLINAINGDAEEETPGWKVGDECIWNRTVKVKGTDTKVKVEAKILTIDARENVCTLELKRTGKPALNADQKTHTKVSLDDVSH